MRYLSLFSGMEAAWLAWHPLGWECAGVAEIEPGPCSVLAHRLQATRPRYLPPRPVDLPEGEPWAFAPERYRHIGFGDRVPNLGDVSQVTDEDIRGLGPIDLVIGGSPCQDLSLAGKRRGLAGARSGLFHQQIRIFHAARHFCGARFLVWENVPGAFSSNTGSDFAVVVGDMAGLDLAVPEDGWGSEGMAVGEHGLVEWCVLDAQWFGLAQRRKRVFAVLDSGDWPGRSPLLLEPDGLRGDLAPRRQARKGTADGTTGRPGISDGVVNALTAHNGQRNEVSDAANGAVIPTWPAEVGCTLTTSYGTKFGYEDQHALGGAPLFVPGVLPEEATPEVSATVTSKWAKGSGGPAGDECQNLVVASLEVAPTLTRGAGSRCGHDCLDDFIAAEYTVAGPLEARQDAGGFPGTDGAISGHVIPVAETGRGEWEEAAVASPLRVGGGHSPATLMAECDVAHTLRGDGFDASEDGTRRGTPLVPVELFDHACVCGHGFFAPTTDALCPKCGSGNGAIHGGPRQVLRPKGCLSPHAPVEQQAEAFRQLDEMLEPEAVSIALRGRDGGGSIEVGDDVAFALRASQGGVDKPHVLTPEHPIGFSCKDSGGDASEDLSPTLRAMNHGDGNPNAGGQVAVAYGFPATLSNAGVDEDIAPTLGAHNNGTNNPAVAYGFGWQEDRNFKVSEEEAPTLTKNQTAAVAVHETDMFGIGGRAPRAKEAREALQTAAGVSYGGDGVSTTGHQGDRVVGAGDAFPTLPAQGANNGGGGGALLHAGMAVRRLTPRECERLQGAPDDWTMVPRATIREKAHAGPCLKQTVTATVVSEKGTHFVATNGIAHPPGTCPRAGMASGEGYALCRDVCGQDAHAEVRALRLAGKRAAGGRLYVEGHTYACADCLGAARAAGIVEVVIGPPPGTMADGPRYKMLGNSFAVPVIRWIGQQVERVVAEGLADQKSGNAAAGGVKVEL